MSQVGGWGIVAFMVDVDGGHDGGTVLDEALARYRGSDLLSLQAKVTTRT
jgi:hypothetical protein